MASFWEEFKNLFKTESQLEEERQNKINDALNQEKEIAKRLEELDAQYKNSLPKEEEPDIEALFPKDSALKEIEYTPVSDEEIVETAKKEIDANKLSSKNNIDENYKKAIASLEENKNSARENLSNSYENLSKLYSELKENANNDSLRRGMARSSVATNRVDALDRAHVVAVGEAEKGYVDTLAKIDDSIATLSRQKDNALEELDIKSALELDQKISVLKDERDEKVKEYEKYNNEIREKNEKYERERQENIEEYLKDWKEKKAQEKEEIEAYEKTHGYSGEKQKNYSERYNIAHDFYSALSADIAVDALKASPNMKYYLGNMYDTLLSALKRRQSSQTTYF